MMIINSKEITLIIFAPTFESFSTTDPIQF